MATLSESKRKQIRKRKRIFSVFIFVCSIFIFPYLSLYIDKLLKYRFDTKKVSITFFQSFLTLVENREQQKIIFILYGFLGILIFMILTSSMDKITRTETMIVAGDIEIPIAVGEGQHGTARFATEKEKESYYCVTHYDGSQITQPGKSFIFRKDMPIKDKNLNLGLVLGMVKEGEKEKIICIEDDIHVNMIGATRSGKSRREIAETIWLRSFCNKSMVINDPKGDLYLFFKDYLEEKGYVVNTFDLNYPRKSMHYNYLHYVILAVNEGDIPQAIDYTWDLVSILVGEPKGEPLWTNGEAAVIAACIMAVVMEAEKQYQNLTNVYEFIHYMCKADDYGNMPITEFFKDLPDVHPAKMVFAAAEISPDKMRGSFFGSALTTLRLFADWNIAEMTSTSDYDLKDIGKRKTALFIIIPDEKKTRYSLASLFIGQAYIALTEVARKSGNRLPVPVDFILDEFGNCPAIPGFGTMMSVGAGRGIRFYLVLQDYQQLEKLYKNDYKNIKGNSQVTVYLKSPTPETLEELSKRTGPYTVQVNSASSQISNKGYSGSASDSANMQSRRLLFPDEVERIDSPYTLVFYTGKRPSIFYAPDLSEYYANKELGLGDKEHNIKVLMERENKREERAITPPNLWGIWKQINDSEKDSDNTEKVSFLD